jgi:hypothetical protein
MDRTELEAKFREWWQSSYGMPPGTHAVMTHVGFAEWLLLQQEKQSDG